MQSCQPDSFKLLASRPRRESRAAALSPCLWYFITASQGDNTAIMKAQVEGKGRCGRPAGALGEQWPCGGLQPWRKSSRTYASTVTLPVAVPHLFTLFPASSHCSLPPHSVPSTTTVKGWALLPTSLWQKASPLLKTSLSLQPLWGVSSSQPPWEWPQSWSVPLLPSLGRTLPTPGKGHLCPPN